MDFDLFSFAAACNLSDPAEFIKKCDRLQQLLEIANNSFNLTRITSPGEFAVKHIADSLTIAAKFPEISQEKLKIADIGCGAGFPSLVLAMAFPDLQITSIDSTGKKIKFVAESATALGLNNLTAIQGRAIELNRKEEFRHRFDIVTARAVAPSPKLYRETDHFLKPQGRWIFYKTPGQAAEEMPELKKSKINWYCSEEFTLPEEAGSRLFIVGKKS